MIINSYMTALLRIIWEKQKREFVTSDKNIFQNLKLATKHELKLINEENEEEVVSFDEEMLDTIEEYIEEQQENLEISKKQKYTMTVKLEEDTFDDIKENGFFVCDGCACGDFVYQLGDNLWINVYRSCRKSSNTPDEKLWELHDINFYNNIIFSHYENNGQKHIDTISEFGKHLKNVKLKKTDKKRLYKILKEITKKTWGNEFRNED